MVHVETGTSKTPVFGNHKKSGENFRKLPCACLVRTHARTSLWCASYLACRNSFELLRYYVMCLHDSLRRRASVTRTIVAISGLSYYILANLNFFYTHLIYEFCKHDTETVTSVFHENIITHAKHINTIFMLQTPFPGALYALTKLLHTRNASHKFGLARASDKMEQGL